MSRIPSILAAFYGQPLAILPAKLEEVRALLRRRDRGEPTPEARVSEVLASRRTDSGVQMAGRVAVVPVLGALAQRVGGMDRASGGVSCEELGATLESLVGDKGVRSICMVFDSPGGAVAGTPELADRMRSLGGRKKIVGIADSTAASAAYWLLSQCAEVNVTTAGMVGSIGVVCAHEDRSAAMDAEGVKTTYVHSGGAPYKVEGAPEYPLSEEARADMQSKVDHFHAMFVRAVARGRNTTEARVAADFGGGRMLTAKDAVARGMADRVATLEQVLSRLGAEGGAGGVAATRLALELAAMDDDD